MIHCYYGNSLWLSLRSCPTSHMNVYFWHAHDLSIGAYSIQQCAIFFVHGRIHVPREMLANRPAGMSLGSFIGYLPGAFLSYSTSTEYLDHNPGIMAGCICILIMAVFLILVPIPAEQLY